MNVKVKDPIIEAEAPRTGQRARPPRSIFGKLAIAALLGGAITSAILMLAVGSLPLLIVTASLLLVAGLASLRFRWTPVLIALVSGTFLYQLCRVPYVTYHLTNPKGEGGLLLFALDLLIIVWVAVACGASIGASVQNYRQGERKAPTWLSSALTGVAGFVVGALLIAALAQPTAPAMGTTYTNGVPTVHMGVGNFTQSTITIAKGSQLLLVDDVGVVHILANGTWKNGTAQPASEPGAPKVNNVQVNGNSTRIGPFTTAGTYHIYCLVHQGMNLTIIVQ